MMYVMKKLNIEKHVATAADKTALEVAGYKLVSQPPEQPSAAEPQAEPEQPSAAEPQAETEQPGADDKPPKRRGGAAK